jgi:hypothetical protein
MADMAIRLAKNPRPQAAELRWDGFLRGRRQEAIGGDGAAPVIGAPVVAVPVPGPSDSAPASELPPLPAITGAKKPLAGRSRKKAPAR